jgi:hypothetical protein
MTKLPLYIVVSTVTPVEDPRLKRFLEQALEYCESVKVVARADEYLMSGLVPNRVSTYVGGRFWLQQTWKTLTDELDTLAMLCYDGKHPLDDLLKSPAKNVTPTKQASEPVWNYDTETATLVPTEEATDWVLREAVSLSANYATMVTTVDFSKNQQYLPNESWILGIITSIRESHPDLTLLYTEGQCWNFYKILKSIFGDVVAAWYDPVEGHMYSKIGDAWYDIRGQHKTVAETCRPYSEVQSSDHADNWGTRDTRRLIDLAVAKVVYSDQNHREALENGGPLLDRLIEVPHKTFENLIDVLSR